MGTPLQRPQRPKSLAWPSFPSPSTRVPASLSYPGQTPTGVSFCPHSGVFCLEERKEVSFPQPLASKETLPFLPPSLLPKPQVTVSVFTYGGAISIQGPKPFGQSVNKHLPQWIRGRLGAPRAVAEPGPSRCPQHQGWAHSRRSVSSRRRTTVRPEPRSLLRPACLLQLCAQPLYGAALETPSG